MSRSGPTPGDATVALNVRVAESTRDALRTRADEGATTVRALVQVAVDSYLAPRASMRERIEALGAEIGIAPGELWTLTLAEFAARRAP